MLTFAARRMSRLNDSMFGALTGKDLTKLDDNDEFQFTMKKRSRSSSSSSSSDSSSDESGDDSSDDDDSGSESDSGGKNKTEKLRPVKLKNGLKSLTKGGRRQGATNGRKVAAKPATAKRPAAKRRKTSA